MQENAVTDQPTLTVARDGARVVVAIACGDVYHAISLYEQLLAAARSGRVMLEVETRARTARVIPFPASRPAPRRS